MSLKVAVLVPLDAQASGLAGLVRALDAQTLQPTQFEVLLVGSQLAEAAQTRLADLVRRRPNVRVVVGSLADAVQQTSAEWVTVLSVRDISLRTGALQRLVERGETTGSDMVLGRVDLSDGRELDDVLARDSEKVSVPPATALAALVLQRHPLAATQGVITDETSAQLVLSGASSVATLGSYQCLSRTWGGRDRLPTHITIDSVMASWQHEVLVVELRGAVKPGTEGNVLAAARAVVSNDDHWLPTDGAISADGKFTATVRLDPASAADGAPLADGRWALTVGVHGDTPGPSGRRRVPHVHGLHHAVITGRPVVAEPGGPSLVLDAGATKSSIIGRVPPGDTTIEETHRGTLLRAQLPRVDSWDAQPAEGQLLLDKFALPARITHVDDATQLQCYLSGLAGRAHLSSRFGRSSASMALELEISGTGAMTVQTQEAPVVAKKSRPPAKKVAPAKKAAAKKAAPVPRRGAVQRLRRALPARLDPAIERITRNSTVRRLYRKAAGLPAR
jgi:hypothetical protein